MLLSPFNPIYFYQDGITKCGAMNGYAHLFSADDTIVIEVLHSSDESIAPLVLSGDTNMELWWSSYSINATKCVSFYELRGLLPGSYELSFGDWKSNPIIVTDDDTVLNETVLIQYAINSDDVRLDVYPVIKGRVRYFEMRLAGGFKDSDWKFSVDNEQFVTDKSDIIELYSVESTDKVLTIGKPEGVPNWVGSALSHILVSSLIFIDGKRYSYTGDTFEAIGNNVDGDKFVYAVSLREARFITATRENQLRALFRKVPTNLRKVNGNLRHL